MITYHNATVSDGHIIHIDEVTKENRAKHYYCVGCGKEMSAVLGDKREHHFRHKGEHCSWESYLHKLGKKRLKERFDTQNEFVIKYVVDYHCDKRKCKLEPLYEPQKCNRREFKELDLKNLYDTCEEEVTYKGYRADLMLSSKEHPEQEPLFLEVSVSHDCEPEKLASGIQIIELKIAEEEDVLRPFIEEDISLGLSNPENPYDINVLPPIRFYNFQRIIETTRPLDRFWIAKDENGILRGYCHENDLNCRNVNDNHREDAIFEVAIPSGAIILKRKPNLYTYGMKKAIEAGVDVRHCDICTKQNSCYLENIEVEDPMTGEKRLVSRPIKMSRIPKQTIDKVAQANRCSNYVRGSIFVDNEYYYHFLPIWTWKKD